MKEQDWRGALLGACLLAAAPIAAFAANESEASGWMLGAGVTYVAADPDRGARHGFGGSAGIAWEVLPWCWAGPRIFGAVLDNDVPGAPNFAQAGAVLDLLFPVGAPGGHRFLLLAGAGGVFNDVGDDTRDGGGTWFDGGIGWRPPRSPHHSLRYRVELRVTADAFEGGRKDTHLNLVAEFGPRRISERIVPPPTSRVRIEGPSAGPDDADGDGVPDDADRCPETLQGAEVAGDGCVWKEQVVVLSKFLFETASAALTSDARELLRQVALFLVNQADVKIDVYGHTDDVGEAAYNLQLSEERAAAVRAFLIRQGIDQTRLDSQGFGESRPLAGNDTEEGRAQNRRVELHIHARERN